MVKPVVPGAWYVPHSLSLCACPKMPVHPGAPHIRPHHPHQNHPTSEDFYRCFLSCAYKSSFY